MHASAIRRSGCREQDIPKAPQSFPPADDILNPEDTGRGAGSVPIEFPHGEKRRKLSHYQQGRQRHLRDDPLPI